MCPHLQIKAPDLIPADSQARVSVTLIGAEQAPTFHWTVTDGVIVSGQGTSSVLIDPRGVTGRSLLAFVELGGLPPECATRGASATVLIGPALKTAQP